MAAIVLGVVVLAALIARPVIAAAVAVLRFVVDVLEVAAIVLVSASGLAVIAGAVILARRTQARRARTAGAVSWALRPAEPVTDRQSASIGPPQRRLHPVPGPDAADRKSAP
ncbi:MAG: hypothetical protein ACLQDY_12875 [Streptosporangiaceae bacterium]